MMDPGLSNAVVTISTTAKDNVIAVLNVVIGAVGLFFAIFITFLFFPKLMHMASDDWWKGPFDK